MIRHPFVARILRALKRANVPSRGSVVASPGPYVDAGYVDADYVSES